MSYHVDAILLTILMFYMVCAVLIIAVHFPFTSKPERLYVSLKRRFFRQCGRLLEQSAASQARLPRARVSGSAALLAKMHHWGALIDGKYFPRNSPQQVANLNRACDLLHGQLQALVMREGEFATNPLIRDARRLSHPNPVAKLCHTLAANGDDGAFEQLQGKLADIKGRLDELLGKDYMHRYETRQLAQFYVYLNLQASILASLRACRLAQQAIDWQQLGETRF